MNLASIVETHPENAVALVSRGLETTYGELRRQVGGLRAGLTQLGVQPGDRVALLCGNNWYFVAGYLAVLGAGAVAVPLNPTSPAAEIAHTLSMADCRGVIVGPAARTSFDASRSIGIGRVEVVVGCGFTPEGGVDHDDLLPLEPTPIVERAASDTAVLIFTSGTAGAPRPAMLTHGNLLANLRQVIAAAEAGSLLVPGEEVALGVLPLFHSYGLNLVLNLTLLMGARVVLVERFDPVSAAETVKKHRVSLVAGPPTMWAAWAGIPGVGPEEFASVHTAVSGAAKLPTVVAQAVEERLGLRLIEGYGLTEATAVVTTGAGVDAPLGSVGIPIPGMEVRLVDESGDDVLVGDAGEIWVRGPNVFAGYFGDDEATARVINAEGWLMTGDSGVVDDEGFLYIVDRLKDLIIVSGFNVFPAEVEEVLASHPAVAHCAVIGVPHPYTGESIKAYVELRSGAHVEEDDLIGHCAQRMARYKCPEKVWFVESIPRHMTGKTLRRFLREQE